jgi:Zn-dependent peptidase ImmA (M78 family)
MIKDFILNEKIDHNKIKRNVNNLLLLYKSKTLPVDVFNIAEQIGIKVLFVKLYNGGISYLYNSEKESSTLLIDSDISYFDKCFLVAHNIGHYITHSKEKKEFMDGPAIFNIELNNIMEYEANLFALYLLLPEDRIIEQYKEIKSNSVNDILVNSLLSAKFGVNTKILDYRLGTIKEYLLNI